VPTTPSCCPTSAGSGSCGQRSSMSPIDGLMDGRSSARSWSCCTNTRPAFRRVLPPPTRTLSLMLGSDRCHPRYGDAVAGPRLGARHRPRRRRWARRGPRPSRIASGCATQPSPPGRWWTTPGSGLPPDSPSTAHHPASLKRGRCLASEKPNPGHAQTSPPWTPSTTLNALSSPAFAQFRQVRANYGSGGRGFESLPARFTRTARSAPRAGRSRRLGSRRGSGAVISWSGRHRPLPTHPPRR
jgi:hypothetical protein